MSIAFVYNADIRNNGTAVLAMTSAKDGLGFGNDCRRYTTQPGIPEDHDLYIYVDDGRDDIDFTPPSPNAYWAIDTHLGYDYRRDKARNFDYVYTAQIEGAAKMCEEGIEAEWLPLACHPTAHPNHKEMLSHPEREKVASSGLDKQHDVAFVGFMNDGRGEGSNNRLDYLEKLFKEQPNSWLSFNVFFEDMAVRFIRARIGFNISIKNDLNMRFFEVMSTGTALLTNRDVEGWEELGFKEGEDFVGYQGEDEMLEKAQWMLDNAEERETIAASGMKKVREFHTYSHRMKYILDKAGVCLPEQRAN